MNNQTMREWSSQTANFSLPLRYLKGGQGRGAVILLHGYQDHALSFVRRMGWLDAKNLPFQFLAINAPFPVPIWTASGFVEAYSWYFRDTTRDLMIVSPADSATQVANLVKNTLPAQTPLVLFGFSQGGILASHLAAQLSDTCGLIAVGSGYPEDAYAELNRSIRVFGIHSDVDEYWPLEKAQPAYEKIMDLGFKGEFHVLPGLGHKADRTIDGLVRELATQAIGAGI